MQSPIDLASPRVSLVRHLGYLNHSYRPAQASIINRGHDIMVRRPSVNGDRSVAILAANFDG
jgi:carbonic anhydrase